MDAYNYNLVDANVARASSNCIQLEITYGTRAPGLSLHRGAPQDLLCYEALISSGPLSTRVLGRGFEDVSALVQSVTETVARRTSQELTYLVLDATGLDEPQRETIAKSLGIRNVHFVA